MTRRDLVKSAAAFTILPAHLVRGYQANEKVNVGVIGVGGVGSGNASKLAQLGENVVALCDVDSGILERRAQSHPKARKYTDFRQMMDKEKLDGVVVATPDHTHAYISITAMKRGLNVYCQKPLTKTIAEARLMAEVARQQKVVTQMGTASAAGETTRRDLELVRSGMLGDITEVHAWTNRALWPQGFTRPTGSDPVPSSLNWDLWLGPAAARPYLAKWPEGHPMYKIPERLNAFRKNWWTDSWPSVYHQFTWRGWQEFGTGALGDIAPHTLNVVFWALELGAPAAVEVVDTSGMTRDMYPEWSILRFDFPSRGARPPVSIYWYDGGKEPVREIAGGDKDEGGLVWIGTKGSWPAARGPYFGKSADAYPKPPAVDWPYQEVHTDWVRGIKTGFQPSAHFGYSGPFTEAYLLGNIALKMGHRIEWNPLTRQITNCREANQYLSHEYRKGWELPV
ncbi:MAG: Gfo/Idh/MocA family oxidoreductase [Acidobacteria bacterium]|nr:Gfo/Idh/MocA family oxidoreductase [Acidobacteriota bacterium]